MCKISHLSNCWCLCHWLWALSSANIVTAGLKATAQQESISSIWCNRDIILQMMRQRFLMSKSECSDHREIWKQISTFSEEADYRQIDLQTGEKSRVALRCPDTQQSYTPGRPGWYQHPVRVLNLQNAPPPHSGLDGGMFLRVAAVLALSHSRLFRGGILEKRSKKSFSLLSLSVHLFLARDLKKNKNLVGSFHK